MAMPTTSTLVSANIVTGFLGSGKTTLLKFALQHGLVGRKVALIVNELGDIGIDGIMLRGMNVDRMVELPSGCVCCTIGSQFALAVQEILETVHPHLLVIETSGVAEPGPLVSELSLIGVKTDSIITVVDVENIHRFCRESEVAVRQVEDADFIVMNKTDLLDSKELIRREKRLRALNSRALLLSTSYGEIDREILFATSPSAYWHRREPDDRSERRHRERDGFTSFSFQAVGETNRDRFEKFLATLPPNVYRAKGIVKCSGEHWSSIFNYTCGRSRMDWLAPARESRFQARAVVIGREMSSVQNEIMRALESCMENAENVSGG